MKRYLPYVRYYIFWLLLFIAARLLFLLYHLPLTKSLNAGEVVDSFYYGLRMDLSFAAYICIFPFLLFAVKSFSPALPDEKVIRVYTNILIVVVSFLVVADAALYSAWRYRMDATPLQYFKEPKELLGTISSAPVTGLIILFILFTVLFVIIYKKFFPAFGKKNIPAVRVWDIALSFFLIAVLFIPIRGGIQKIPMNISDVYFSKNTFANHAAINLPWNLSFSLLNRHNEKNPFDYMPPEEAESLVKELYDTGSPSFPFILNKEKPNLIFIILESFTSKWVSYLNGLEGVTPELEKIAADGLAFTNIYASGDRSEKGQIAILSAYPNQAITSIIKTPTKTQSLPAINQVLSVHGYHTSFVYGGELEFANIKSYLLNTGFDKLIDKYDFPIAQRTTSWGVHDEYVFNRYEKELEKMRDPFFSVLFTLSSHEPYDVPLMHFEGNDNTTLFKNSIYYTDSLLGNFIRKSKLTSWWPNALIVIVADHGHLLPGPDANDSPSKFTIPLIFTGGALKMKGKINTIGSQTDIIPTILAQMNIPSDDFKWGRNLLDSAARPFAFYSFNNGFGWVTPEGTATVDNISKEIIHKDPDFDTTQLKFGKAYMQYSYQDFLKR